MVLYCLQCNESVLDANMNLIHPAKDTLPAVYMQPRSPVIRWLFWRSVLAPWSHLHDLGDSQQAVQTNREREKEKAYLLME